jgi:F-type H+-transporting ATPase subunit delta
LIIRRLLFLSLSLSLMKLIITTTLSVIKQYFVSSGFAFAHADSSVDILAVEAVPVEHLDETVVRKMLSEHTAKFQAAKDDYEKATHQIGIDVTTAMVSAIENMGK